MRRRKFDQNHRKNPDNDAILGVIAGLALLGLARMLFEAIAAHPALSACSAAAAAGVALWWWRHKRRPISSAPAPVLPNDTAPPSPVSIPPDHSPASDDVRLYQHQLAVLADTWSIKPAKILGDEECRPFYGAKDALEQLKPFTNRWHVHAQVSMGEFLQTGFDRARSTFNAKRVDLLICDNFGNPRLVIEHQGSGHINPLTPEEDRLRNEVKHEVLRKANIPLIQTPANVTSDNARIPIVAALSEILAGPHTSAPTTPDPR